MVPTGRIGHTPVGIQTLQKYPGRNAGLGRNTFHKRAEGQRQQGASENRLRRPRGCGVGESDPF